MKRCVIIGGAPITDYNIIKHYLNDDDYAVYCDSGLYHESGLGLTPSLIVGDFDSCKNPHRDIETLVLPREKDDTDTMFAVKTALKRGYRDFLLIGVIGARLDHTLGNVYILDYLNKMNATGVIMDDYGEMEIVGHVSVPVPDTYSYFSLLSMWGDAKGVYIQNAKYPLIDATITTDYQYGVSNEPLKDGAEIWVTNGKLLLIKIR